MANQGPQRAADEPYGEASFSISPDIPSHCHFQNKGGPQRPPVLMLTLFSPAFCLVLAVAQTIPLHLPVVLERRRFWGGVSELEGHLPVLEGLRGALASRAFGCPEPLSGRFGAAPRLVRDGQVRRRSVGVACPEQPLHNA